MTGHIVATGCAGLIGSHLTDRLLDDGHEIVIHGDRPQTRGFAYVNDIVDGLVLAHKGPAGADVNLGGGNEVSLAKAIATLGEVMGRSRRSFDSLWRPGMRGTPWQT